MKIPSTKKACTGLSVKMNHIGCPTVRLGTGGAASADDEPSDVYMSAKEGGGWQYYQTLDGKYYQVSKE